ncbi:hypothetical protein [Streptomyces sp. JJ36]|uniref:hypothetical protein n=1 Tax=Streptomyces sp. JJ36 TaxID=2736645 RepID=UPI001F182D68|nr:hypothetical protein [Streptomyces sp. JJ36]MCF6523524.1 hypothetical protein [Streptomyces sp. JJ36]
MSVPLSFYRSMTSHRLRAEGRIQGRIEGRVESILLVLEKRGIEVPDEARERITTCRDFGILRTWFTRAATVASADELFAPPES